jgi:hypothetical protein
MLNKISAWVCLLCYKWKYTIKILVFLSVLLEVISLTMFTTMNREAVTV